MHNQKNIVLMFLIVMLSFAIVSEVSAASSDEAEPGESCLNVCSTETGSYSERFPDVLVDNHNDCPHSNNDQTSLREAPFGADENKTFYERIPADHNKRQHFNAINGQGEKMNSFNDIYDSGLGGKFTPGWGVIDASEVNDNVISELICLDNVSVAFKNNKKDYSNVSPEFNGILANLFPNETFLLFENVSFKEDSAGKHDNFTQFDRDLPLNDSNKKNISLSNSGLSGINAAIQKSGEKSQRFKIDEMNIFLNEFEDFLLSHNLKHTQFKKSKIFSII